MTAIVSDLFHYPIKGLSAQRLDGVELHAGQGFPADRTYGFARPGSGFDPANPRPLPKTKFVVLARDAGLALLDTHFDPDTERLTIRKDGKTLGFDLAQDADRKAAARALSDHLDFPEDMTPTLYSAHPHRFTDVSVVSAEMMNAVSLINIDTVAAFSDAVRQNVDPARFRGNILLSGIPAFAELDWVGKSLTIGEVEMQIVQRTRRCPATEVDPITAQRDLDVPGLLRQHYGHSDMGVYAEIRRGGTIRAGDAVTLS